MQRSGPKNFVQMKLDFGQKNFRSIQCKTCEMIYLPNVKEDVLQHERYHKSLSTCASKVARWKNDKVVEEYFDGSRILCVRAEDFASQTRFIGVRKVMQTALGNDNLSVSAVAASKSAYLYINSKGSIVGCCIAEQIDRGNRVIVLDSEEKENLPSARPLDASRMCLTVNEKAEAAKCGIYRVWIAVDHRGRGIASALIDCIRHHLIYGFVIERSQVAFTDPTPNGRDFAEKYCKRADFLVYRSQSEVKKDVSSSAQR